MTMKAMLSFAVLGVAVALSGAAKAVDFAGKRIEWIIPFPEAGGTDVWARFFVEPLSRELPGKPTIIIRNVPGGGSITGANMFAQRAKPDGLMLLGTSASTQFPYLLDDPRVKYDYKEWTALLASPTGGVVFVRPEVGIQNVREIKKIQGQPLKFGSQGAVSLDLIPLLAFELLGMKVEPVFGMSRGQARLAFERGEATIDFQTTSAYLKQVIPLVQQGKAVPLFSFGVLDEKGDLKRDPTFRDMPHFGEVYEMVHGSKPSGPAFEAYKSFLQAGFGAQKAIFVPKETPKDIVDAYTQAIERLLKNAEFRKTVDEELGDYEQYTGERTTTLVRQATTVEPEAKQWIKDWLTKRYNVKF
jgi:tripartite-type tricarboxylate transporter receptor subunit TctC